MNCADQTSYKNVRAKFFIQLLCLNDNEYEIWSSMKTTTTNVRKFHHMMWVYLLFVHISLFQGYNIHKVAQIRFFVLY